MENSADSFAHYLAKNLVSQKGYSEGTVQEATGLFAAADIVLTISGGAGFSIVCIVDAEKDPQKHFRMESEQLREILESCRQYAGRQMSSSLPVGIEIIEVRAHVTDDDKRRLAEIKGPGAFSGMVVSAYMIDMSTQTIEDNGRHFTRRVPYLKKLLKAPRKSDAELFAPAKPMGSDAAPWATYLLIGLIGVVFAAEFIFQVMPAHGLLEPDIRTLIALGGVDRESVLHEHGWYRIFTAVLLHGSLLHIVFNGFALRIGGTLVERWLGSAWLLTLFFLSGIGGALMSIACNPPNMISVGASGAIMGLFVAALVASLRLPATAFRSRVRTSLVVIIVVSLLPMATTIAGEHIDFGAHLGGSILGGLLGVFVLVTWPADQPLPRFRRLAAVIAVFGLCTYGVAFALVARDFHPHTLVKFVIPDESLPKNDGAKDELAHLTAWKKLAREYPRDPRSHLFYAISLFDEWQSKKTPAALPAIEAELKAALADREMLQLINQLTANRTEVATRSMLAEVYLADSNVVEAGEAARPVCSGALGESFKAEIISDGLCKAVGLNAAAPANEP